MTKKYNLSKEQAQKEVKKHGSVSAAARALGIDRSTFRGILGRPDTSKAKNKIIKEKIGVVEEHSLKQENKRLKKQLASVAEETSYSKDMSDLLRLFTSASVTAPKWVSPKLTASKDRVIITAMLSDTHFDEVVRPEQINYVNAYNREIGVLRLQNFFINLIRLSRDYINGVQVDGLVLQLLGDIVSGNIHEELKETNDAHILQTCLFWAGQIAAGIEMLTSHFDKIYIPCVVGNHGRMDKKPKAKFRAQDNFDWLIYNLLAIHFKDIKEVSFDISDGADLQYTTYSTVLHLTHGDQFRGGSGIAGMLSPLMLGDARKRKRENAVGTPYDYLCMGHWHQLAHFKGIIINGSLKGYDEYASISNFDFEPPQQGMFLIGPKWGKGITAPIHVLHADEYWRKR